MSLVAVLFLIELEIDSHLDSPYIEHCGYRVNGEDSRSEWCYREYLG